VLELPLPGLPGELDGLRIAHLSDFHLGVPSRGARAVERAVEWTRGRRPDLVVVTGDLLSHPRARTRLDGLLRGLDAYVVPGNHDAAVTRDPFSRAGALDDLPATMLTSTSTTISLEGVRVQLAGLEPDPWARPPAVDPEAAFRVLLSHYPRLLVPGYHLVLSGHMHGGQIVVPYPGGKLRLAHPRSQLTEGLYREGGVTLHVSPGLGTTFVPFRFFARPEVTELVLRSADVD
jgi:predicted MPP superfamily phosphohydrolase